MKNATSRSSVEPCFNTSVFFTIMRIFVRISIRREKTTCMVVVYSNLTYSSVHLSTIPKIHVHSKYNRQFYTEL